MALKVGEFVAGPTVRLRKCWLVEGSDSLSINGREVIVHQPIAVYLDEARARQRAKAEMQLDQRGTFETVVSWLWLEDSVDSA